LRVLCSVVTRRDFGKIALDEAGIALDLDLPVDELVARTYTAVTTAAAPPVHHNGKEASP
jgi:hypothetical protein